MDVSPSDSALLRWIGRAALAVGLILAAALPAARAEDNKRDFDIPAGPAELTLRQFAEQAGIQFVYSADKVKGVRTNALKGGYSPREGLSLLVAGTPLRVVQDDVTGALTVDRRPAAQISDATYSPKKKLP